MTYRLAGATAFPGFGKEPLGRLRAALRSALSDAGFVEVLGFGCTPPEAEIRALLADCGLAALLFPSSTARVDRGESGVGCAGVASLTPQGSIAYRIAGGIDDIAGIVRILAEAAEPWPLLPGPLSRNAAADSALPLVFVGPMASGKTTLGSLLARREGMAFIDLDDLVEARAGHPVDRIFEVEGEEGFRLRESEALEYALGEAGSKAGGRSTIIATGGGAVLAQRNRALLAGRARVVWLHGGASTLAARAAVDAASPGGRRPLLSGVDPLARLSALQKERLPFYASAADFLLPVEGRSACDLAEVLHDALF